MMLVRCWKLFGALTAYPIDVLQTHFPILVHGIVTFSGTVVPLNRDVMVILLQVW
jgi:hypothetical protein